MAAQNAPTAVLESFHNVKEATVRLGLSKAGDENDKRGQKWLRDGVNLLGFPHTRMAGQLMFSDSQLAEIAALNANAPTRRGRTRRPRRTASKPASRE
jgi:hypothetical protein